ncbi:bifunctional alpha,alpha-trehalose-phosphate synthase (UDP-forming)/trehalose-phosphatase [Puteibacter caeruleilacunae]|nr:bifunctional alpha,alpha-trehalose-phosphate synthase (UDP-forming)/trehalose-phosphatase [Puteibacter caeruleilacunae]
MPKIHIVSNRLPLSINKNDNEISAVPSVGGLATGMRSIYKDYGGKWIGWTGINEEDILPEDQGYIDDILEKNSCIGVSLSSNEVTLFYEGFSNNTIWPLFHYFTQYTAHDHAAWDAYKEVNQKFADKALEVAEDGDIVWIHDYQLLLVPEMIKARRPSVTVGFFLHIPFPSFEVFRILPWRKELLQGVLGADLIGFHTYDYQRHFFSCVRRILGYEISFNKIHLEDRIILTDAFPMGIDYEKFHKSAIANIQKPLNEKSDLSKELEKYFLLGDNQRLVLSIDRMDYSKGIPNRLRAFEMFLEKYPEYIGCVTMIMLAVPSRDEVERYIQLKKEVDELVGRINGRFGSINYTPIWYFYRSLPFDNLIELYSSSSVALITPVRDGMNLVAKEYVACRTSNTGVVILSEMAGVAKEMGEALIINPNNEEEIAEAIAQALKMSIEEQQERMLLLQDRIKRYNVFKWSQEFLDGLHRIKEFQQNFLAKKITDKINQKIQSQYSSAEKRMIFLDYDGTLSGFKANPQDAKPDQELLDLLEDLQRDPRNIITIISGRDRETLEKWLGHFKVNLIVEHGVWLKTYGEEWELIANVNNSWMPQIRPILETFVDRTPGTNIEEKNYSLVWHYRKAEPEQGELRANELKDSLHTLTANLDLEIMEGNKVIEVKSGGINKGVAALRFLQNKAFDFVIAIGDDWTDEYMFRELGNHEQTKDCAVTIKVGLKNTSAGYKLESVGAVRKFLKGLTVLNTTKNQETQEV